MLRDELAAFLQELHVHLLQVEIRRDEPAATIVGIRMSGQLAAVERACRRRGDAVAVDEGVKPVGGGAAGRAKKAVKTVIERSTLDTTGVVHTPDIVQTSAVNRHPRLIAKGESDVPFADGSGGVALLLQHRREGEAAFADQRWPAHALEDGAAIRHAKGHLARHEAVA